MVLPLMAVYSASSGSCYVLTENERGWMVSMAVHSVSSASCYVLTEYERGWMG
jgi:hypothetical protein